MAKTIYTMWKRCEAEYAALPAVRWLVRKKVQERSYGELAAAVKSIRKGFAAEGFSRAITPPFRWTRDFPQRI